MHSLLIAAALVLPSFAAFINSSSELKNYDFVVIGAGPGGSAVSNRLTENSSISVLVLEAGGANNDDLTIDVPLLCTKLTPRTEYDWNYTTTPQPNLNGRTLPFPRGMGLGGTSADCLVYTRGSRQNIDKFAEIAGDSSWGWDAMLPYFKKSEKFNFPVDGHNISSEFDPAFHGFDGYIGVSVPGAGRAIDDRVIQTTEELADEFPFAIDMNTGDHLGVSWVQALVDRGVRSSSAAYFNPARDNLDILLHARVSRVLTSSNNTFNVVEYLDPADGESILYLRQLKTITAAKEVILSAGAVGTPSILLHSGIGNATTLTSLGIEPLVDLPSVGRNLTDHIGVSSTWLVNSTLTYDSVLRNDTLAEELLEQWKETKTGIYVDTSENHLAFLRLPDNSTVLQTFGDPAAGNETAHYEFLFQNGLNQVTASGNYLNIPAGNVSPKSSGAVTINSTDPFDAPLIDPGLLSEEVDLHVLREAIRSAHRFVQANAWSGYILQDLTNATTDDEIDTFIRQNAVSFFHPVATAAMSPFNVTDWGVVDPDLKVKGVSGLRIVDASVVPSLPSAHTSAITYGVSERAADIIKAAYGLL